MMSQTLEARSDIIIASNVRVGISQPGKLLTPCVLQANNLQSSPKETACNRSKKTKTETLCPNQEKNRHMPELFDINIHPKKMHLSQRNAFS
jgi:hypothetical protein